MVWVIHGHQTYQYTVFLGLPSLPSALGPNSWDQAKARCLGEEGGHVVAHLGGGQPGNSSLWEQDAGPL